MTHLHILILEDHLEAVSKILHLLGELEETHKVSFAATVLPDYIQTEEFINKNPHIKFDIVLLDRDCFLGGSFHILNLDLFNKKNVIAISSIPEYNWQAEKRGVKHTVWKDYKNLDGFVEKLKQELTNLIPQLQG